MKQNYIQMMSSQYIKLIITCDFSSIFGGPGTECDPLVWCIETVLWHIPIGH